MKYFFDTEFIEGFRKPLFGKRSHFIDLISIGIVTENSKKFYQISCEYNYNDADEWVKQNVILPLYLQTVSGDQRNRLTVENFHKFYGLTNKQIADAIKEFIYTTSGINNPNTIGNWDKVKNKFPIDFYAYYADYDWVLLCSLFGRMIDLPKGFPMYCNDLKQSLDAYVTQWRSDRIKNEQKPINFASWETYLISVKNHPDYPKQENEHNALDDAQWNFKLFKFLETVRV